MSCGQPILTVAKDWVHWAGNGDLGKIQWCLLQCDRIIGKGVTETQGNIDSWDLWGGGKWWQGERTLFLPHYPYPLYSFPSQDSACCLGVGTKGRYRHSQLDAPEREAGFSGAGVCSTWSPLHSQISPWLNTWGQHSSMKKIRKPEGELNRVVKDSNLIFEKRWDQSGKMSVDHC